MFNIWTHPLALGLSYGLFYDLFSLIFLHDRDTLVADDINQANRIAFGSQRFRTVTLDGKLIEITGVMSGGGTRVIRGKMGTQVS